MVNLSQLPDLNSEQSQAYRLVNSKFPPIALFDDVANPEEFEALYQTQALDCPLHHRHLQPIHHIGFFHSDSLCLNFGLSTLGRTAYRSSTTNDLAIKSRTPPRRSTAVSSAVMSFTTVV